MFNVADILELVVDGFNERPFPQQDFVVQVHERVLHVLLEFGHKVYVVNEKPFEKLLSYVSPVGKILPKSLCVKSLSFNGSRSSTFPGVSVHCIISPRSFITICSLNP